jgi:hypothetical protein
MKIVFLIISAALLLGYGYSLREISVPEPEFTGIILLVRSDDSGEQLEKQKAASASKADIGAALFGVSKGKGMNMVNGIQSPVRTIGGDKISLIARVRENDRDPVEVINIFKMEKDIKKERRTLVTGTVNFNQSTALDIDFLPFEASRYGQSSYLIELSEIPAGEYAITLEGSRDIFNLFGVD